MALAAGLLGPTGTPAAGDSSEDEDGAGARLAARGRYYRFARTVVTREPPSPCPLPLSHIDQLDGVDDGGDKGQRGQREGPPPGPPPRPPPTTTTAAAEDLPSDIVDFVLKNMVGDAAKATAAQASGVNGAGAAPWLAEGSARRPVGGGRGCQDGHRDGLGGTHGHHVLDGRGAHGHVIGGLVARGDANGDANGDAGGTANGHVALEDATHRNGAHGRVTRLGAGRHGVNPDEAGGRWASPWATAGAPKRPGETPGPGAKRARLEVAGDEGDGTEEKPDAK